MPAASSSSSSPHLPRSPLEGRSRPSPPTLTTSSCTTETAAGMHLFNVYNYVYTVVMAYLAGGCLRSGVFRVGNLDWAIELFPSGLTGGDPVVSVFLMLLTPNAAARVAYDLRVVDQTAVMLSRSLFALAGDGEAARRRRDVFSTRPGAGYQPKRGVVALQHSLLLTPQHVRRSNLLSIRCEMEVIKHPVVVSSETQITPPPAMAADLGRLLQDKESADVTLLAGGTPFDAHRAVLAARSPVLREQLHGQEKNTNTITISMDGDDGGGASMTPRAMWAMLHFIYTDELPLENAGGGGEEMETFRCLLAAARRYSMEGLRKACESVLCSKLHRHTYDRIYDLAKEYDCEDLMEACCMFFLAISPCSTDSQAYKEMENNFIKRL